MLRVRTAVEERVTTVVMTRDRRAQLLTSLGRATGRVVVVDNGSSDGTVDAIHREFPDVRVIALGENRGAVARNVGVDAAVTPYVAFADDDSWWDPESLATAADLLDEHADWALVAGTLLLGDSRVPDPLAAAMADSALPLAGSSGVGHRLIAGFAACGAVVRVRAWQQVGGFDDVVFFAGEEERVALDLLSTGWRLVHAPELVAHHHPEPGPERSDRHAVIARNSLLTALMRRPWPVVVRRSAELGRAARPLDWVRVLPACARALRRRRPSPPWVEDYLTRAATTSGRSSSQSARNLASP